MYIDENGNYRILDSCEGCGCRSGPNATCEKKPSLAQVLHCFLFDIGQETGVNLLYFANGSEFELVNELVYEVLERFKQ
jgi:hypothetical protein